MVVSSNGASVSPSAAIQSVAAKSFRLDALLDAPGARHRLACLTPSLGSHGQARPDSTATKRGNGIEKRGTVTRHDDAPPRRGGSIPSQTNGQLFLLATQEGRGAMDQDMNRAAACGPWSPATSQPASARIWSSVVSSASLGEIRVDQELEHLTDGPLPAYGFFERQVGLDLVAVATASVLHGWR